MGNHVWQPIGALLASMRVCVCSTHINSQTHRRHQASHFPTAGRFMPPLTVSLTSFAFDQWRWLGVLPHPQGVVPDIVTMAKGIGNGLPLAAVVTTPEIAASMAGRLHFNT